MEKLLYNFEPYPLKCCGRAIVRPRRLIIWPSAAAISIGPAVEEEFPSIERGASLWEPATTLRVFLRGFTVFLCGFRRPIDGLLIRGFTVVTALVATVSCLCDSRSFLCINVAVALACLSCSFWRRSTSLFCVRYVFSAVLVSQLVS